MNITSFHKPDLSVSQQAIKQMYTTFTKGGSRQGSISPIGNNPESNDVSQQVILERPASAAVPRSSQNAKKRYMSPTRSSNMKTAVASVSVMSSICDDPKTVESNQGHLDSLMKTNLKVRKQLQFMNSIKSKNRPNTAANNRIPTKV